MGKPVYSPQETIAAISTPPGEGGIAVVRVSGGEALEIASRIFRGKVDPQQAKSHTVHHGRIMNPVTQEELDEVLLTVMRSPKSYTGEEVVEINCHGGFLVSRKVLEATLSAGARLASPGEFTLRAFVSGRLDLSQAEAVAEVIGAKSELALRAAQEQLSGELSSRIEEIRGRLVDLLAELEAEIDFPEEEIERPEADEVASSLGPVREGIEKLLATHKSGETLRRGFSVVIAGRTNVGKSSLLNRLLETDRAIVTPHPGTTRDVISEFVDLSGVPVRLIDTAGLRSSTGEIENLGITKTEEEIEKADLILLLFDASEAPKEEDREAFRRISQRSFVPVINKIDIGSAENMDALRAEFCNQRGIEISALYGTNLDSLREEIKRQAVSLDEWHDQRLVLINTRHREALLKTRESLLSAEKGLNEGLPSEFIAAELRGALSHLGEIIGETVDEEILGRIFEKFCIGK
jgi:tRNA modification GTPase